MVDYEATLFQHPPEVWSYEKCAKMVKHWEKDGLGTKYPFQGYIGCNYGVTRFNGGCERDGQWWQGELIPLPIVPKEYEIVKVPTWGYKIVKVEK